jgi:phage regulator Rha-like protein
VAEKFGKRHDAVLRDIRNLDCSEEFWVHNFVESNSSFILGGLDGLDILLF